MRCDTNKTSNYGQWLEEWIKVYKEPYLKPSSVTRIRYALKTVPQWLKDKRIKAVNALDIDRALSECTLPRSRKYLYHILTSSLKKAYNMGIMKENISVKVYPIKHRQRRGKALTVTEQAEFLKAIETSRYRNYFEFLLLTGCRRSEALALRWSDIDEELKEIYIHGTKTESSERIIFLLPTIAKVLARQRTISNGERVFPYRGDNVTHAFKSICPKHKLHDLRHTFITRCAESGINVNVAQKLAGHSDINTTLQIYTHVTTEFQRKEFEKFSLQNE